MFPSSLVHPSVYSSFLFLFASLVFLFFFFFNDTATTEIYTLSLHDALPILVVFFIAFRWIHLSTPLIRLFLLVLILLLMPTLNFLPVWFALSLLRFRLPSRLPMMFILWMVAMMVVIIPSRTESEPNRRSEDR